MRRKLSRRIYDLLFYEFNTLFACVTYVILESMLMNISGDVLTNRESLWHFVAYR